MNYKIIKNLKARKIKPIILNYMAMKKEKNKMNK